jgi:hypothetical protein
MIERDIRLRVIDEAAEGEEIDFAKGIDVATKGVSQAEAAFAAARTGCIVCWAMRDSQNLAD